MQAVGERTLGNARLLIPADEKGFEGWDNYGYSDGSDIQLLPLLWLTFR